MIRLGRTLIAALLLAAGSAGAAVLGTEPFTVDATGHGGGKVDGILAVDYSFGLGLDSVGPAFSVAGIGFASSYRKKISDPPIPGTGLGTAYGLYAQILAAGHAVPTGDPSLVIGKYDSFHVDVRLDPLLNSAADGTGQGDDITIFSGELDAGAAINSIDRASGLFKVLIDPTFTLPSAFKFDSGGAKVLMTGVFAGDDATFSGGTVFNAPIGGSGNFSAVASIPEPGVTLMLALGAVGLLGVHKLRSWS